MLLLIRFKPPKSALSLEVSQLPQMKRNIPWAGMREGHLALGVRSFATGDSCSLFLGWSRPAYPALEDWAEAPRGFAGLQRLTPSRSLRLSSSLHCFNWRIMAFER